MSLSQKHSGKVLVPWFNISEWKSVYNLIYSEGPDWPLALQILKIWKLRTPLLSAGVEGTLIILEALLVNTSQLSSYETTHIFSTSLVRFLNLCAASSDKQGTFYMTALKNELPRWLINIRHDIAHNHTVPSQSMLELSLKFCLDWLKVKYWDVQHECMSDFIVTKVNETLVENCVYIYTNLQESEAVQDNKELMKCISKIVKGDQQVSRNKIMGRVNSLLNKAIQNDRKGSAEKISTLLIDNCTMLSITCESHKSGTKKIPEEFLNKWNELLNIVHESEIMPDFIFKLFQFVCDDKNDLLHREVASLWIKEIFLCLIDTENSEHTSDLCFEKTNNCMKIKAFATEILENPTPFTLNFVQEVLKYNNAPSEFIDDSVNIIKAFQTLNITDNNKILTVEDLNIDVEELTVNGLNCETSQQNSRWILIEDTSQYMNLPLGILPHQERNKNPLLNI